MISVVGSYKYMIEAYLSDFRGKATLPMIGGFMLQAATRHAEERGFGYSNMTKLNRVWVLTRMAIEIFEYPANDTEITLHTWVSDVNKLFTERCFSIENSEGKEIGFTRSLWASIDMETRRPTNVLELEGLTDFKSDKICPIEPAGKILLLKDRTEPVTSFVVKYSDIDINKHLNSMKYIEHFVDIFPLSMYQGGEIRKLEINYIFEGKYGTMLNIERKEIATDVFSLEMTHDDKVICTSKVTWQKL
ncbi:MAG: acyl-[acyl-carrier-protein] thioesterase [Dysgonomonas sp.]